MGLWQRRWTRDVRQLWARKAGVALCLRNPQKISPLHIFFLVQFQPRGEGKKKRWYVHISYELSKEIFYFSKYLSRKKVHLPNTFSCWDSSYHDHSLSASAKGASYPHNKGWGQYDLLSCWQVIIISLVSLVTVSVWVVAVFSERQLWMWKLLKASRSNLQWLVNYMVRETERERPEKTHLRSLEKTRYKGQVREGHWGLESERRKLRTRLGFVSCQPEAFCFPNVIIFQFW